MQYVVYDKHDGVILSVKKGGSVKVTQEVAESMFPNRRVGVWRLFRANRSRPC